MSFIFQTLFRMYTGRMYAKKSQYKEEYLSVTDD